MWNSKHQDIILLNTFLVLLIITQIMVPLKAQESESDNQKIFIAGNSVHLKVIFVSGHTVRINLSPVSNKGNNDLGGDDSILVNRKWPSPVIDTTLITDDLKVETKNISVIVSSNPLRFDLSQKNGTGSQNIGISTRGEISFILGNSLIYGLGQGGQQFDRRGAFYPGKPVRGPWKMAEFGGYLPIPWLMSNQGWALFLHQPEVNTDLTGTEGYFKPLSAEDILPIDLFVILADDPQVLLQEYDELTGYPSMPPLWALGYQQSHRTLADSAEVLSIAETFRKKELPCDVLIYLGTGWCPSGWNTGHNSMFFNQKVFPDPKAMSGNFKELGFEVILHAVFPPHELYGSIHDLQNVDSDTNHVSNYWVRHIPVMQTGAAGWWPDAGEELSIRSRLARIRMYWEGPQKVHPNQRPFALHRTGYSGMQRYGGWIWSGDVYSNWEMLRKQIPIGLNVSLSGLPYWGTDTGGFWPTSELSGELYVRWFQFSAFCPLFRSHGRIWKTRLPWGWNMGELGPMEATLDPAGQAAPDTRELNNPEVEPICRKYLNLRYQLLPYLYSLTYDAHQKGLPLMRPLWFHYPEDPRSFSCIDEYLWGRNILVAPVLEKGTTDRQVFLPAGEWYDFWTNQHVSGGQQITRPVDLATLPLYVQAGSIIPMGPLKQYTSEKPNDPLTLLIYPGSSGRFILYEDDGLTFDYQNGKFMSLALRWDDQNRLFSIDLIKGSQTLPPMQRNIKITIVPEGISRSVIFKGNFLEVNFNKL